MVDWDCGYFKDKIVTTDTQKERDKGAFGTFRLYLLFTREPTAYPFYNGHLFCACWNEHKKTLSEPLLLFVLTLLGKQDKVPAYCVCQVQSSGQTRS